MWPQATLFLSLSPIVLICKLGPEAPWLWRDQMIVSGWALWVQCRGLTWG